MRRPALTFLTLASLVTAAVLVANLAGPPPSDPYPSPRSGDPSGTLAFQMLLARRGASSTVHAGLPRGTDRTLLWFAKTPRAYTEEETEAALAWVRGGGRLLLVCDARSPVPASLLLDRLGLKFEPAPFGEPSPARTSPFTGVLLRPAAFELREGDARVRGLTADSRPCWVSGTLGQGTWEALADSYPYENEGLDRGGNAYFALSMAGERPWVDLTLFQVGDATGTLGNEPLFWGALLQFALLGGLLLLALRRLGPALEPPAAAGSLRLRAGIARTLAERGSPRELVDVEASSGGWSPGEGEALRAQARGGDWAGAYRKVRRRLVEKG